MVVSTEYLVYFYKFGTRHEHVIPRSAHFAETYIMGAGVPAGQISDRNHKAFDMKDLIHMHICHFLLKRDVET